MIFVDTNYFLRFLINENAIQHQQATKIFESAAKGEIKLFTSVIVFFEIYWVLASFYAKEKSQIAIILEELLKMNFIKYENLSILNQATEILAQTNFDLEDAYNLVFAKKSKANKFLTFDKKLQSKF